jgi:hypothetical protein
MNPGFTRRQFVASAAGWLILPSARAARTYHANEQLNLAVVGMAGDGAYHGFAELIHAYDTVAHAVSCDVDLRKVRRAAALLEYPYREGWRL